MASTEIDYETAAPKKSGIAKFCSDVGRFIWNSDTGEFIGRTGKSWGLISLFYFVYYTCLAAFFAAMLAMFFTTIDEKYPRLSGVDSLLKLNPGLGFRPMPRHQSTLIKFKQGEKSTYKVYTDHIEAFLSEYNNNSPNAEACDESNPDRADPEKACKFDLNVLGSECTAQKDYGYFEGTPCVLVKLNKIYGWKPELYADNSSAPAHLRENFSDKHVMLSCEGENSPDDENMGNMTFTPSQGFPAVYFPYMNQDGFVSPLVMIQFNNIKKGVLVQVWCKAWAPNIKNNDKLDRPGSVHFELLID